MRESGRRFEEDTYQQLLEKVDRKINALDPAGDPADPSPKPAPQTAVPLSTVKVDFDQPWLTNDTEVDSYVAKLSSALKQAIQDGKRVQL